MLCKSFTKLSIVEKIQFVGELFHAVQSDEDAFNQAKIIIKNGKDRGDFDGVKILPPFEEDIKNQL